MKNFKEKLGGKRNRQSNDLSWLSPESRHRIGRQYRRLYYRCRRTTVYNLFVDTTKHPLRQLAPAPSARAS